MESSWQSHIDYVKNKGPPPPGDSKLQTWHPAILGGRGTQL